MVQRIQEVVKAHAVSKNWMGENSKENIQLFNTRQPGNKNVKLLFDGDICNE